MPWRLIVFVIIFAVFLAFITFNLENKCDISFGFKVFRDVPVFHTIFTSFVLGLICALPLAIRRKKPKSAEIPVNDKNPKKEEVPKKDEKTGGGPYAIDSGK